MDETTSESELSCASLSDSDSCGDCDRALYHNKVSCMVINEVMIYLEAGLLHVRTTRLNIHYLPSLEKSCGRRLAESIIIVQ